MSDNFLSRWSRRKQQVRLAKEPDQVASPQPPSEAHAPGAAGEGAEDGLTPEEVAALPPIDTLTVDSDVTGFLRKGVPDFLRNAALRRMWSLDPAIRDYVGEALDYAYDWNVPGGVPGNGPLLPSDDVAAMVRQVFHGAEPQSEAVADGADASEAGSQAAPARDGAPVEHVGEQTNSVPRQDGPTERLSASTDRPEAGEITPAAEDSAPTPSGRAGRHGGATPH